MRPSLYNIVIYVLCSLRQASLRSQFQKKELPFAEKIPKLAILTVSYRVCCAIFRGIAKTEFVGWLGVSSGGKTRPWRVVGWRCGKRRASVCLTFQFTVLPGPAGSSSSEACLAISASHPCPVIALFVSSIHLQRSVRDQFL
jgi:hypothetical protein